MSSFPHLDYDTGPGDRFVISSVVRPSSSTRQVIGFFSTMTVTSQWAQWRLKSWTFRLFAQPFVQAHIKEHVKYSRDWLLWRNPPVVGECTSQRASYAENVSICWRHHDDAENSE